MVLFGSFGTEQERLIYLYSFFLAVSSARAEEEEEEENGERTPEQLEEVEVVLNTLELREFEVAPKRNRKKRRKKPKALTGKWLRLRRCPLTEVHWYLPFLGLLLLG